VSGTSIPTQKIKIKTASGVSKYKTKMNGKALTKAGEMS
jgi:hypothetical protein